MSEHETLGDESEIPCPWCDYAMSLQDAWTDGCVDEGFEDECVNCGKMFEVVSVHSSITICVDRARPTPEGEK